MKQRTTKTDLSGKTVIFNQEVHKPKQTTFPNQGVSLKIDCHVGEHQLILSGYIFRSHVVLFSQCTQFLTLVGSISEQQLLQLKCKLDTH